LRVVLRSSHNLDSFVTEQGRHDYLITKDGLRDLNIALAMNIAAFAAEVRMRPNFNVDD